MRRKAADRLFFTAAAPMATIIARVGSLFRLSAGMRKCGAQAQGNPAGAKDKKRIHTFLFELTKRNVVSKGTTRGHAAKRLAACFSPPPRR